VFLADRTNGRAYATLLRPSVVCNPCIVAKWRVAASPTKVTIDSLQEVVCEESIGTKINDLDLCLQVVEIMSTIASHFQLNILETR